MLGWGQAALDTCTEFTIKYPTSKWAPDVMFWIGEYEFNRRNHKEAEAQFAGLAKKFPDHELAEAALLWAGKAAARQKEYLRANEHFQDLVKRYPFGAKAAEARYSQGDALSELGKFSSAILIFEEIIANYDTYVVDLAWGRKGDCEFALGGTEPGRYESAMDSYRVVVNSATASAETKLQAQYKIGRCMQKMGLNDEAFEQYYAKVVVPYLDDKSSGASHNPVSEVWFTQAAFDAAGILEKQEKWAEAAHLLKRVADAGIAASEQARERINELRRKNWPLTL
jgi:TolA-binding protein